jgi:hypothetical protein
MYWSMTLDAPSAHVRYQLELPTSWNMIYQSMLVNLALHVSGLKHGFRTEVQWELLGHFREQK